MNQKAILADLDTSMATLRHRRDIIMGLPFGEYLSLTGLERHWNGRGQYTTNEFQAFVKPISYNRLSVRCRVVATNAGCFKGDPAAIEFDCIKKWEPLSLIDLPRAMSWKRYPLYEQMLLKGKIEGSSGGIDIIPLKDLKTKVNPAAMGTWWKYTVPCPVCRCDIRLYNPHTHKCDGCGYTFRTPEDLKKVLLKKE